MFKATSCNLKKVYLWLDGDLEFVGESLADKHTLYFLLPYTI